MFILGAHRSGTSATTRLLNLMGVDLGRIPIRAAADNAKGFWEHPDVVAINEAVLALLGSRWDDATPLPPGWWAMAALAPQRHAIRRLLEEGFPDAAVVGMKDPRLCRLLPLWLLALDSLPLTPVFVLVLRHPCEVAASIRHRNRLPSHAGEALWLTHMLDAERYTRHAPRVFVSYEALLADWRAQARRIAAATGVSWARPEDEVEAEASRFLDPELRHFTALGAEWRSGLSPWVSLAYGLMSAASRAETAEIRTGLASLGETFGAAQALFGPLLADAHAEARRATRAIDEVAASARTVAARCEAIRLREHELAEQMAWAQATVREVATRDQTIRELQALLAEQTRWAKQSARDVVDRDVIIGELQAALQRQTRWAEKSAQDVIFRDAVIGGLQAALQAHAQRAEASVARIAAADEVIRQLTGQVADLRRGVSDSLDAR